MSRKGNLLRIRFDEGKPALDNSVQRALADELNLSDPINAFCYGGSTWMLLLDGSSYGHKSGDELRKLVQVHPHIQYRWHSKPPDYNKVSSTHAVWVCVHIGKPVPQPCTPKTNGLYAGREPLWEFVV